MTNAQCVFCKIARGELPTQFVYQSNSVIVFLALEPGAAYHFLVVPRKHIRNFAALGPEDKEIWGEMTEVAQNLIKENGLEEKGFRVVMNGGRAAHVHHLHMHVLGGIDVQRPN